MPTHDLLPPSVVALEASHPARFREVADDFRRLTLASQALATAQDRLPELVACSGPTAVLDLLVAAARALTGSPSVWALTWTGELERGRASFRAFVGDGAPLPAPVEVSGSVIAQVAREGRPVWSDDASVDARFASAESIQAFSMKSVGCVPIGPRGVLYLHDPEQPGRFSMAHRYELTALCRVAAPFLAPAAAPVRRRPVEPVEGLVGSTPAMEELFEGIRAFAPMPWPALVLGESGTGKELVARAIHRLSGRGDKPFVAINCGAIPEDLAESTLFGHERGAFTGADRSKEGVVERVRGGTLFLDEIGELAPRLQVKLLRLLQEGTFERVGGTREQRFSGRVVAATLRDLDDPEARGPFREDLYYRLAACVLRAPPLRERRADIPDLAAHLLARAMGELPGTKPLLLSPDAEQLLAARPWPGNVRDLENALRGAIARAVASRAPVIRSEHFRAPSGPGRAEDPVVVGDLQEATKAFQRRMIDAALEETDGNRTKAAQRLGVSRQWLHRLMAREEGA